MEDFPLFRSDDLFGKEFVRKKNTKTEKFRTDVCKLKYLVISEPKLSERIPNYTDLFFYEIFSLKTSNLKERF